MIYQVSYFIFVEVCRMKNRLAISSPHLCYVHIMCTVFTNFDLCARVNISIH